MKLNEQIIIELINWLKQNRPDLNLFKRQMAKKYRLSCPNNLSLLKAYHNLIKKKKIKKQALIEKLLRLRPIRSLSGIVNITVLTKPYPCPGQCLYCPIEKGLPKSYLSGEPAVERAKRLNFDPYQQVKKRVEMLRNEGHPTDKIELRIVGGTWSCYPRKYQNWFIKRCFDACNQSVSHSLIEAQRKNEKAKNRIVGISIETRPDFINEDEIKNLRRLGITMVEIGVQTIFDEILEKNKTGLNQKEIARATKLLKDAGFKVLYHLMLNLPGSDLKKDYQEFKIIFTDERFKPDWLKIYPLVVIKNTPLYKIWLKGRYQPYSEKKLITLLIKIKKILPYWVRVARILRDIPLTKIEAGCRIANLREVIKKEMTKRNLICQCIRCREVKERYKPKEKIYLFREDYQASDGREIFLSYENKKRTKLYSLLRLRIPGTKSLSIFPVLANSAIIREIKTYGELVPIAQKGLAPQHRGLGKKLIKKAEEITKNEFHRNKIAVIAGIGVRNYFRQLDYRLKETYMVKSLDLVS